MLFWWLQSGFSVFRESLRSGVGRVFALMPRIFQDSSSAYQLRSYSLLANFLIWELLLIKCWELYDIFLTFDWLVSGKNALTEYWRQLFNSMIQNLWICLSESIFLIRISGLINLRVHSLWKLNLMRRILMLLKAWGLTEHDDIC